MRTDQPAFSFTGVVERDIDLLMLEEFVASPAFAAWFFAAATGADLAVDRCVSAKHSARDASGESDLVIPLLARDGRPVALVIENKIGAPLQPEQAVRYVQRVDRSRAEHAGDDALLCIAAPGAYFGDADDTKGFGSRVTYEAMLDWFNEVADLGARAAVKTALLRAAIEKATTGWSRTADASVNAFWDGYWRMCCALAPSLNMRKPDGVPSRSTFVGFSAARVPRPARVWHKMTHGRVDLEIPGIAPQLGALRTMLAGVEGVEVVTAGKSAAVRIHVPKLDLARPVDAQEPEVRAAFEAAERLSDLASRWGAEIAALRSGG